jgi:hypothetical protein
MCFTRWTAHCLPLWTESLSSCWQLLLKRNTSQGPGFSLRCWVLGSLLPALKGRIVELSRIFRVLTMVCKAQNYCVCGLCPSSGILNIRKHSVSETGSVPIFRWGEGSNRVGVSFPSPEDGNSSSFRNAVFFRYLKFRTMDKAQKSNDSETYVHLASRSTESL